MTAPWHYSGAPDLHPKIERGPTWGEEHRAACEARTVMQWEKPARSKYYELVQQKRGPAAMQKLKADVAEQWAKREGSDLWTR